MDEGDDHEDGDAGETAAAQGCVRFQPGEPHDVRAPYHLARQQSPELAQRSGELFAYECDIGASWVHDIVAQRSRDRDAGVTYPVCVAGAGTCPPEEFGGVWGYRNLLEAPANPNRADREEHLESFPESFDAEAFALLAHERG